MSLRRGWGLPILPGEPLLAERLHQPRVAGSVCLLILCCFAVAGLWPFRQIPNEVTWLADRPGVHFGKHGIILSAGALPAVGSGDCSIEMWVRPAGGEESSTLLAFYTATGGTGISLQRSLTDLRLDRETAGGRPDKSYVNDVLFDGKLVFLTVVSSAQGTAVYLDGALVRKVSRLRARSGDCSGSVGVGHPARGHNSWQGEIYGLAIYNHELTSVQVQSSYRSWLTTGRPDDRNGERPGALYPFSEKGGSVVRDHGPAGVNLTIPELYSNIQRTWLESPRLAFEPRWGYLDDIVINIGGFVPFGFAFSLFLASTGRIRRVGAWAILGGLCVSLVIEILQVYLPTRNSDLTDVLTNTLGASLGAAIYALWQRRILRAGVAAGGPVALLHGASR